MVLRKVAQAASAGFVKSDEFDKFWPLPDKFIDDKPVPSFAETPKEFRKRILENLNRK